MILHIGFEAYKTKIRAKGSKGRMVKKGVEYFTETVTVHSSSFATCCWAGHGFLGATCGCEAACLLPACLPALPAIRSELKFPPPTPEPLSLYKSLVLLTPRGPSWHIRLSVTCLWLPVSHQIQVTLLLLVPGPHTKSETLICHLGGTLCHSLFYVYIPY